MLPELMLEKAKIIRAVMTVSWKAITNLCEGKRLKHASLLLPSAFCNLKWIDQMVNKKLKDGLKAKSNQIKSAF